ncbi:hypothetical protein AQ490_20755 [Wenjunlia vitaminophila]|uniref:L,D-TPase catalytic domain-containing protein n=1 Tax=Wenjunlia vitaminophila TaxID=76728 RepID=A0A0T6LTY8_WENVI|nr:Ig-like domain-containing protein [Wenjunlia vitaminophila]KRV49417.1 hypothetical protein AQ490_20755 [Wenjunlia vitaminophila]
MLLLVPACGGDDDGGGGKDGGDQKSNSVGSDKVKERDTAASKAVVTVAPENNADDVATNGVLKVTAQKGKLTSVKVTDDKGGEVPGEISKDGMSWEPSEHLGTGTKYVVDAVAEDSEGRESAKHSTFTTVVPKDTFIGYFTPENGQTVGAGMEVSLNFNQPITNRAEVEEAVQVTANPSVPVEGHWFGNQRLDFRPEKYWAAGTKVTLKLRLKGVEGADGIYGTQSKDVSFTVGRNQVSVVDATKKTMTVTRDGKLLKTIPITAGAPATTTYNGKMVITEKLQVTRMDGATVGFGGEYDIKDVPHAMRLTTSGTFIHGNYWKAKSIFGSENVSHGCVGLFDRRGGSDPTTDASWFFNNSLIGDVVEVVNSEDKIVSPDNGLNGWNMSWAEWTAEQ